MTDSLYGEPNNPTDSGEYNNNEKKQSMDGPSPTPSVEEKEIIAEHPFAVFPATPSSPKDNKREKIERAAKDFSDHFTPVMKELAEEGNKPPEVKVCPECQFETPSYPHEKYAHQRDCNRNNKPQSESGEYYCDEPRCLRICDKGHAPATKNGWEANFDRNWVPDQYGIIAVTASWMKSFIRTLLATERESAHVFSRELKVFEFERGRTQTKEKFIALAEVIKTEIQGKPEMDYAFYALTDFISQVKNI